MLVLFVINCLYLVKNHENIQVLQVLNILNMVFCVFSITECFSVVDSLHIVGQSAVGEEQMTFCSLFWK